MEISIFGNNLKGLESYRLPRQSHRDLGTCWVAGGLKVWLPGWDSLWEQENSEWAWSSSERLCQKGKERQRGIFHLKRVTCKWNGNGEAFQVKSRREKGNCENCERLPKSWKKVQGSCCVLMLIPFPFFSFLWRETVESDLPFPRWHPDFYPVFLLYQTTLLPCPPECLQCYEVSKTMVKHKQLNNWGQRVLIFQESGVIGNFAIVS